MDERTDAKMLDQIWKWIALYIVMLVYMRAVVVTTESIRAIVKALEEMENAMMTAEETDQRQYQQWYSLQIATEMSRMMAERAHMMILEQQEELQWLLHQTSYIVDSMPKTIDGLEESHMLEIEVSRRYRLSLSKAVRAELWKSFREDRLVEIQQRFLDCSDNQEGHKISSIM